MLLLGDIVFGSFVVGIFSWGSLVRKFVFILDCCVSSVCMVLWCLVLVFDRLDNYLLCWFFGSISVWLSRVLIVIQLVVKLESVMQLVVQVGCCMLIVGWVFVVGCFFGIYLRIGDGMCVSGDLVQMCVVLGIGVMGVWIGWFGYYDFS